MMQEEVAFKFHRDVGLPVTIMRPGPMYGPRHKYGVYHILLAIKRLGEGIVVSIYPNSKRLRYPSVHIADVCRAATFLADKKEAIGEAYNVVDDELHTQDEMAEFVASMFGYSCIRIPVWWPVYKFLSKPALVYAKVQERRARGRGIRPKMDTPMVEYVTHQYWFSNEKIKRSGFKFLYPDFHRGLWEYVGWCRERGWL